MTMLTNEIKCKIFYDEYLGKLLENLHLWFDSQEFANVIDINLSYYENQMGGETWQAKVYYTIQDTD